MKPASPFQRALAVHVAGAGGASPARYATWRSTLLIGAIPLLGVVAVVVELIRWRFF